MSDPNFPFTEQNSIDYFHFFSDSWLSDFCVKESMLRVKRNVL
jgi:hypothetical protein